MSSTLVEYPAQVKSYQVTIARDRADIHLEGVEQGGSKPQPVGHMTVSYTHLTLPTIYSV